MPMPESPTARLWLYLAVLLALVAIVAAIFSGAQYLVFFGALAVIAAVVAFTDLGNLGDGG